MATYLRVGLPFSPNGLNAESKSLPYAMSCSSCFWITSGGRVQNDSEDKGSLDAMLDASFVSV